MLTFRALALRQEESRCVVLKSFKVTNVALKIVPCNILKVHNICIKVRFKIKGRRLNQCSNRYFTLTFIMILLENTYSRALSY